MRQLLLTLLLAFSLVEATVAVPAYPRPRKTVQGDGTTLTIRTSGDEFFHYKTTLDGLLLAYNEATQCYEYASIVDGTLTPSGITAHDEGERTASELAYISGQKSESTAAYKQAGAKKAQTKRARRSSASTSRAGIYGPSYVSPKMRCTSVPTTGKQKALAILVDFPDKKFSDHVGDAKDFYTHMLNDKNYTNDFGATCSAYDFYYASSVGQYEPEFDIVGPVTVSKSYTYYGGKPGDGMAYVPNLVAEAATIAADSVNMADYDSDGDGYMDFVYIFYAGYGQADSDYKNVIWPHSWDLTSAGIHLKLDGVTLDNYACSQELLGTVVNKGTHTIGTPVGIGTFVHEFGHVLGIPDLYNTGNTVDSDYNTPGYFDTMDCGSYNNDQYTPALFTAYERYVLGWLEPTLLTAGTDATWTLPPLADENKAYLVKTTEDSNYYILENRQQKGLDTYLPWHGMLVWRIQENDSTWYYNTVNNSTDTSGKGVYISPTKISKQASNQDYYNPFPGVASVTGKTFWDTNSNIVFGFKDVTESDDGTISFKISNPGYLPTTGISNATITDETGKKQYFDLQGRKVTKPTKGIYIVKQGTQTTKVSFK